ncbi:Putative zn(2)Cys(6) fungal-type DNA-binding domain, fungal transcription factor [Colletotrichum destructivum]|uniref:Zn(2)Cys(6) fungal-type DNA-binding domain, fungal transcription factor n=1 Tax=Colletotrichum destructivum TaxID=34406 RepID=A0AAX4IS61_9PEZI|nr:Putative zn(2)Cys(6) fungal-type DNA-binding domain, fungal transcription factor [Colletotrichum destructivum]
MTTNADMYEQGCANCERRRIRCDFQSPKCAKCHKKGLECPGYNRQLRWVNGVAARGYLRGRAVPVRPGPWVQDESETSNRPSLNVSTHIPTPCEAGGSRTQATVSGPDTIPRVPSCDLLGPTAAFMDYYRQKVAGLMVWLDSDENFYRRKVVPLAESHPAIRFAIMALAAQHGTWTLPAESITVIAEDSRNRCLTVLQRRAREMTTRLMGGSELDQQEDMADAEWMLASILIMANFENARCSPQVADGHRRAARTIVNLFSDATWTAGGRELFAFLRNQLAIDNILGATTSFDPSLIRDAITPAPGSDDQLFSKYLAFLHEVTLSTLTASTASTGADLPTGSAEKPRRLTLRMVQSEFTQARGADLIAAGRMGLAGSRLSRDFVCLVEVYHNAGLLYSFRCLGCADEGGTEWDAAASGLFRHLVGFEDQAVFVQNLPWPAFIAGTACYRDQARQKVVLELFAAIHRATRFNHYLDAVDFLETFWAGDDPDWRPLAQAREAAGNRILVV